MKIRTLTVATQNRTHFVPADHPDHREMLSRALRDVDPAVLVYPDGREQLFTPGD